MLFSVLIVLTFQLLSVQGAYDLIIEDVTTAEYSEEYLNEPDIYVDDNFKLVINLTIVKQFPSTTAGRLSLMGASMGEYVVDTGIDVTMNFCEFVEEPIVIGPLFQAIGFDPNHCPPDVGVYGTENYEPITEGMPDDFPPNMYRTVLDIYTEEQKILILHIFSKIV
ncbi:GSCOCG00007708001-RA-CDS [Cotesia congregata]|nr:GSCOCG00007708001-RA-CDS [Cotesia congregata]